MMGKFFQQRFFKPRTKQEAMYYKQRLSIIYAIVGWNCFGFAFYVLLKDKIPEDAKGRRTAYGHLTGTSKNMHVYQVKGLTLTNEFEVAQIEKETEENEKAKTDKS